MNTKPITPKAHGIIDYAFGSVLMAAPAMLPMNKQARNTYMALAGSFAGLNAFTDTPVGLNRKLSFRSHQKADLGVLAGLALLTATSMIRKDKTALYFHLGVLGVSLINYVLTDYKAGT